MFPFPTFAVGKPQSRYITSVSTGVDGTTHTFSTTEIGAADTSRRIIVAISARRTTDASISISSVTVGGISATIVISKQSVTAGSITAIAIADVPTGTTATVEIVTSNTTDAVAAGIYALYGKASATPTTTASAGEPDPLDLSVNTQANDFIVASSFGQVAGGDTQWTGLTEDFDTSPQASVNHSSASLIPSSVETPRTISVDWDVPTTFESACLALWR